MDRQKSNKKTVFIGTVIGGVVGATSAIFLAPKSGKEIRNDVKNQVDLAKDKTVQIKDQVHGKLNDVSTLVKDKSSTVSKEIIDQVEELLENEIDRINKMNVSLEDIKDVTKDLIKEEFKSGNELKDIVKEEMTDMEKQVRQEIADLKKEVQEKNKVASG